MFAVLTALVMMLLVVPTARAQSNHDLEPPVQLDLPGISFATSPTRQPQYRFAVANLNDNGKVDIGQSVIEQVPVEGSDIKPEKVVQNYTVMVPYTEKLKDGKLVTKMRTETRTREVVVHRGAMKSIKRVKTHEFAIADLKCFDINGKQLEAGKIRDQLGERRAVILIDQPEDIDRYFKEILRADAMFVIRDQARLQALIKEEAQDRLR
jgi:hypothetical protein